MSAEQDQQSFVDTAGLFRPLGRELVVLLRSLGGDAWSRSTSAAEWQVRDVAAHLLDVDLRRLSSSRDAHLPPAPRDAITGTADLVAYLNGLNRAWIDAARRLSPRVLIDLLEVSIEHVADLMEAADPWAAATFPVAWAGDATSPMWLDIGREYTERWHHQDQIRDACDAPPLRGREWLQPVIEISLRALPHTYRGIAAPTGTRLSLNVTGDAGGSWILEATPTWVLREGLPPSAACRVTAPDLGFARLLLHRLSPAAARSILRVEGDANLAEPLLTARAVMV